MTGLIEKARELTPVEEHNGVLYKRDDLFRPFPDEAINGGKVRQTINLIHQNLDMIREEYHGKVATTCQKDSPQGLIVARIARAFNLDSFVGYGNIGKKTLLENKFIHQIRNNNGIVESIIRQGFDNAITSRLIKLQHAGDGNNFFVIKFGIDVGHNEVVVDCIADQVQNIPDKLDNIVIPTGSGITAAAILKGIKKYGKKILTVYVVHVSGEDRRKKIDKIAPGSDYQYVLGTGFKYAEKVKRNASKKLNFDLIYEAKVYDWMMHNIDIRGEKTMFWVVGNLNYYRQ